MKEIKFKYRNWYKGLPPRKIKLEIPGWAGEKTHETGQPWHCKPFVDGSTYGFELIYPFDTEVRVRCDNDEGYSEFLFNHTNEWDMLPDGCPMANFAPGHYGFTSSLDIKTEPGWGTMVLPHPKFYTDRSYTTPIPVAGLLETDIWPKIFFLAFKAPAKGQDHVFRKGEGIAHFIFVPKEVKYNYDRMTKEEEHRREKAEKCLQNYGEKIFTKRWKDKHGHGFDNKYKILSQMAKKKNPDKIEKYLCDIVDNEEKKIKEKEEEKRKNFKFRFVKPKRRNNVN